MKIARLFLISFICFKNSLIEAIVIGGGIFVYAEDFPYQASLTLGKEPFCGAAIIHPQWLVTAAHCLHGKDISRFKVRTGSTHRYNDGEVHEIEKVIVHPGYNLHKSTASNDIGLIKLTKFIEFNDKQMMIRMTLGYPKAGDTMVVSGFGLENKDPRSKPMQLKATNLTTVALEICKRIYHSDPITDKQICADSKTADSSCHGDSGGPGVVNGRLAGIVSSGIGCKTDQVPAVFTAVDKYLDWINEYAYPV